MRSGSALIWSLLVLGVALGMLALFATKKLYGPNAPPQGRQLVKQARQLDAAARAHIEELAIRFAPGESRGAALDLQNPGERDFEFLEGILRGGDEKSRVSAAKVLRDIGAARSVDPLMGAVRGVDPKLDSYFVECALTVLAGKAPEPYRSALIPALENHRKELEPELVALVRLKLRDAGAFDAAYLREAALSDRDPVVRRFAVREIASGSHPPRGVLAAAMGDPDPTVRLDAQAALETHPRDTASPALQ